MHYQFSCLIYLIYVLLCLLFITIIFISWICTCSVLCESSDTKRTPPILTILSIGIWADHLFFKWDSWCSRSVFVEMDLLKAFIKSIYEKAWRAIISGCNHPMKKNESGELVSKLEKEWSANKDKLANNNWKAFNVIFNTIDGN